MNVFIIGASGYGVDALRSLRAVRVAPRHAQITRIWWCRLTIARLTLSSCLARLSASHAIWRANATEMGLAAGIFTNNINISRRVSREIHAGTIWTNAWAELNDGCAEGGFKQSGVGRLRGPLAITEFQEAKTVVHSIPPLQA